jgi:gliding motility-associated-like protein
LQSTDEDFAYTFDIPGTYDIKLYGLNSSGCTDSANYEITVHPNLEGVENVLVCTNSLYTLPDGTEILIENDYVHTSILESSHGCDSIIVTTIKTQANSFSGDTIFVDYGTNVILSNGEELDVIETVLDTFLLVSETGCDSIQAITYIVVDFIFSPPNIFTPNADNANNTFYFPPENVQTFECVILNRWGVAVFHFNAITDQWDGKNETNGKNCPDGVYFYTYSGTFISSQLLQGQGTVQLVRK